METNVSAGQVRGAKTGRQTVKKAILFSALALVLVLGTVSFSMPTALAANTITVQGKSLDGKTLNMWIAIKQNGSTVKTGFTPLAFSGATGSTYTVIASDYSKGSIYFDHWGNGSTNRERTVTLKSNVWFDAYYKTSTSSSTSALTVRAYTTGGDALSMYAVIKSGSTTVKSGFTPLTYTSTAGKSYTVTMSNYQDLTFSSWGSGSGSSNPRTVTLSGDTTATAYYNKGTTTSTSSSSTTGIKSLLPKTGVFVALYMYPGTTGSVHWQKVIDEKTKHPSVPIVAVFNPSSGPGNAKDSNIANWVTKLKNAGVIAIGYVYDDYGTRSLSALKADTDKYKNWYNADGLFIDEFTNKAGYENHYRDLTAYAKSLGMKMTMGNPGTDVPQSYIGTVDVINITEGKGYVPISWLQYCISCTSSGWHDDYDKRNFAYIRYDIDWLDTAFETESSKWVGLLYITNGDDSNARWFHVPPYFSTLVATLDK